MQVNRIRLYAEHILCKNLGLTGICTGNLSNSDTSMGNIKVNSLDIKSPTWTGNYFLGIPINISVRNPKQVIVLFDGKVQIHQQMILYLLH